jgi:P2 family phage major capsid protein
MRNDTVDLFDAYMDRLAEINGVSPDRVRDGKSFTVDPTVQQKLEDKAQESSAFLGSINLFGVDEMEGATVGLGVGGLIASRTDTSGASRRSTRSVHGLEELSYKVVQTNFDTHVTFAQLDTWAKFPDFQTRISAHVLARCQLDRIAIGFNGTSAAATTDRVANPLGQDINVGWLERMRTENQIRVMDEGTKEAGKVLVGRGGDYATLDALVWEAGQSLLPSWARGRTDLVAITGFDLLHDKYFNLINKDQEPTEQLATDLIMSTQRLGRKPAALAPYFPDGTVFITPLKNLSIYYQNGKRRRHLRENPEANRIDDFNSSNEGYVVEDYDFACLIENIELLPEDE